MRLATIVTPSGQRLHVRGRSGYVDAAQATGNPDYAELTAVVEGGRRALDALAPLAKQDGIEFPESAFGPAVPAPKRVICVGVNYLEHAIEGGREAPTWPESFLRTSASVAPPFGELVQPALSDRFDYEGELGIVIGSGGRYVHPDDALDAIFGFTVLNDASARDWQRVMTQWTPGKNFDGTMPIGPEVVTIDEVEFSDLLLETRLNGEVMQSAKTSQMIVDVPGCVEYFSSFTELRPGDVIATGTPGGVGFGRTPPVWLQPGDVIEVSVEEIGTIRNTVVKEKADVTDWKWHPVGQMTVGI
jgi:acylpyruvate hydrolase